MKAIKASAKKRFQPGAISQSRPENRQSGPKNANRNKIRSVFLFIGMIALVGQLQKTEYRQTKINLVAP